MSDYEELKKLETYDTLKKRIDFIDYSKLPKDIFTGTYSPFFIRGRYSGKSIIEALKQKNFLCTEILKNELVIYK